MKIHKREAWLPVGEPFRGPAFNWGPVTTAVAHYPGVKDVPDGDFQGKDYEPEARLANYDYRIPPFLRNINEYYKSKGYVIGYNWAIDWLGGIWELRGFDLKCAANITANDFTCAVLFLVDDQNEATELQVLAFRELFTWMEQLKGSKLNILPHNELPDKNSPTGKVRTTCSGSGIINQWKQGFLSPAIPFPPVPNPAPPNYNFVPHSGEEMGYIGYIEGVPGRILLTPLGWRFIKSINGDGGTTEVAYLEFLRLAKRDDKGNDFKFGKEIPKIFPFNPGVFQ